MEAFRVYTTISRAQNCLQKTEALTCCNSNSNCDVGLRGVVGVERLLFRNLQNSEVHFQIPKRENDHSRELAHMTL